jgi:hypothetical protein
MPAPEVVSVVFLVAASTFGCGGEAVERVVDPPANDAGEDVSLADGAAAEAGVADSPTDTGGEDPCATVGSSPVVIDSCCNGTYCRGRCITGKDPHCSCGPFSAGCPEGAVCCSATEWCWALEECPTR